MTLYFNTHTHSSIEHEGEDKLAQGREEKLSKIIFILLGFTFATSAHSISEEVTRFSPLWFPREKLFVSLVSFYVLVFDCCTCYSLSKDPNIILD